MADLSSVIAINVVLDNSGVSPIIKIIDTSAYAVGIPQTIKGVLSIQQPDGITVSNTDFTNPDIYYNVGLGALVQASKPLRLANNGRFQSNGIGYTITYTVRAAGFTDTVLVKTFTFNYNPITQVLAPGFDDFTPSLKVTDATSYGQTGFNFVTVSEQWAAIIDNVLGTSQPITGSGGVFDLAFNGNYYDSKYTITLNSTVTYQLPNTSTYVTLVDLFSVTEVLYSEIPPTLLQLLGLLTTLKSQLDASLNNCATYNALQATYTLAVSIYTHMIDRGQAGQLSGLSDYVFQLQKIFNNGVQPAPANTGGLIPPYNWGGGSGTTINWTNITGKPATTIMQWTVGQGGFPLAGANTATNAGFANQTVICFRNNILEYVTKPLASATVTFGSAFITGELIWIQSIPM